jgi:hypothetical protein
MLGHKRQLKVRVQSSGSRLPAQRTRRRRHLLRAIATAGALGAASARLCAAQEPDWDQIANIKEAATHLAKLQRTQGATAAFTFIDACYKTHQLSSKYTRAFEACIAQDYLETQILTIIYTRLPPETLKRMGAPTPAVLVETMSRRVVSAFANYKKPLATVVAFGRLVDEHGFPVFFKALFPDSKVPVPRPLVPQQK